MAVWNKEGEREMSVCVCKRERSHSGQLPFSIPSVTYFRMDPGRVNSTSYGFLLFFPSLHFFLLGAAAQIVPYPTGPEPAEQVCPSAMFSLIFLLPGQATCSAQVPKEPQVPGVPVSPASSRGSPHSTKTDFECLL